MTDATQVKLPQLPEPTIKRGEAVQFINCGFADCDLFTDDDMRDYATNALAAVKAGQEEQELSDEEERKAFENWFTGGDFELKRLGDSYALSSAHNNWQACKARSARSRTDSIIVEAKG